MMNHLFLDQKVRGIAIAATTAFLVSASTSAFSSQKLIIESWRNDDSKIWNDVIIPKFNQSHPNIQVIFAPSAPADYIPVLNAKLKAGTAGDLITCKPFDASLSLYKKGHLDSLNNLPGMSNFSDVAKSAWITDDGSNSFCLPMASVIHGFIFNKAIFNELNITIPKTESEFFTVLATIKNNSRYTPLVMGTADQWEAATMGFQNIGPNYWKGEQGRKNLITGKEKLSDPQYIKVWKSLAKWAPFMGRGYEAQKYPDSQNLFTLGRGAIYPAGSWDIATFNSQADFEFGAFYPPPPNGQKTCYISDHTDIALGLNSASKNKENAKIFLNWMASQEFAQLYSNQLPGFFSLSKHSIKVRDPVAQEFLSWRKSCEKTIRNSYQILSRGEPNLENELWNVSVQVLNGTMTPEQAGEKAEKSLMNWYKPHQ